MYGALFTGIVGADVTGSPTRGAARAIELFRIVAPAKRVRLLDEGCLCTLPAIVSRIY